MQRVAQAAPNVSGIVGAEHDYFYLAKLRLGLRAIERQTSHLPAAAPGINENLGAIANGLTAVDSTLGGVHEALLKQEERT